MSGSPDRTSTLLAIEHGLTMTEVRKLTGKSGSTLVRWCKDNRQLFLVVLKGCQQIKREMKDV